MTMSKDASESRLEDDSALFESSGVVDSMTTELSHVPPKITCGVPAALGNAMHRCPGHRLPSELEDQR